MAMYSRKQSKLESKQKLDKAYLSYYNEMREGDKQPMTRYHWEKSGRRSGYYGTKGTTSGTAKLRRSERKRFGSED